MAVTEAAQQKQRQISALRLLQGEVQRNRERLIKVDSIISTTSIVDYPITLDVWKAIAKEVLDAIRDATLAQDITELYDNLSFVASSLATYNHFALGGERLDIARTERLPLLKALMHDTLKMTQKALEGLRAEIAFLEGADGRKVARESLH